MRWDRLWNTGVRSLTSFKALFEKPDAVQLRWVEPEGGGPGVLRFEVLRRQGGYDYKMVVDGHMALTPMVSRVKKT